MRKLFTIKFDENRIFGLDILRAVAITMVVSEHGSPLLHLNRFLWYDGVTMFFVLSGFLIGRLIIQSFEENKNNLNKKILIDFWIRRWFRTLPAYYLVLVIHLLIVLFITKKFRYTILTYFGFMQNFAWHKLSVFGESWSLCVEEWFYFLVPIIVYVFVKRFRFPCKKAVFITIVSIFVLGFISRYIKYIHFNPMKMNIEIFWENKISWVVITRMDSIMYGVLGAYVFYYYSPPRYNIWSRFKILFFIIGIASLVGMKFYGIYSHQMFSSLFYFPIESLAVLMTLPFLSGIKKGKGIAYRIITRLSIISYSLYLIHYRFIEENMVKIKSIYWAKDNSQTTAVLFYIIYWTVSLALATLLYKYFEYPITKLRDNKKVRNIIARFV